MYRARSPNNFHCPGHLYARYVIGNIEYNIFHCDCFCCYQNKPSNPSLCHMLWCNVHVCEFVAGNRSISEWGVNIGVTIEWWSDTGWRIFSSWGYRVCPIPYRRSWWVPMSNLYAGPQHVQFVSWFPRWMHHVHLKFSYTIDYCCHYVLCIYQLSSNLCHFPIESYLYDSTTSRSFLDR